MKYAIVGNRVGWHFTSIVRALDRFKITSADTIISGGADGVDTFAQEYAKFIGCKMIIHYPDNKKKSPERYFERNRAIVDESDIVIAFDRGSSGRTGTANATNYANKIGKEFIVFT